MYFFTIKSEEQTKIITAVPEIIGKSKIFFLSSVNRNPRDTKYSSVFQKRPDTMAKRKISLDLKECALRLWELGWDIPFITEALCILQSSLYRWHDIFEEFQSVTHPPSRLAGWP